MTPLPRAGPTVLVLALTVIAAPARAGWQSFTSGDGLGRDGVNVLLVDTRDHLWFGTNDGLSEFDGVRWKTYARTQGLPTDVVKALAEDGSGNIWVGTTAAADDGSAIARIRNGRVFRFPTVDGLVAGVGVRLLVPAADGSVWAVHDGNRGVSRFRDGRWVRFTGELADSTVYSAVVSGDGSVWFGTRRGLSRYDGAWNSYPGATYITHLVEDSAGTLWSGSEMTGQLHRFRNGRFELQLAVSVQALLAAADGSVWVASPGSLHRWVNDSFSVVPLPAGWAGSAETLFEDRDGGIWITGPGEGAARWNGVSWDPFDEEGGLVSDSVPVIAQDRAGNLWFASCCAFSGASRFDGERWVTLKVGDGAAGNSVGALWEGRDGTLWVGTGDGVRGVRDGVAGQPFDALKGRRVRAVLEDAAGDLWAGTDEGVWHLAAGAWEHTLSGCDVWALHQDWSGGLWFGTAYKGVIHRRGSEVDTLAVEGVVRDIISDRAGRVWFATLFGDGVLRRENGVLITVPGFSTAAYRLHQAFNGALWVATDRGVGRLEHDRFVPVESPSWLLTATLSIAEDDSGNLWFGTNEGLHRYDGERWASLSDVDGIRGRSVPAALADSRGRLWFGTPDGLVLHEPDRVPPRAVLAAEPPALSLASEHTFSTLAAFGEMGVEFSFSLADPAATTDPVWFPWSSQASWTGNLPDGDHVFLARARDRLGNVQIAPTRAVLEIDATPPVPLITAPFYDEVVSGTVRIEGSADDPRFRGSVVDVRSGSGLHLLAEHASPIVDGELALWNTTLAAEGQHTVRVSVIDTLGATGSDSVRVVVDNRPPFAPETSPVRILAGQGGHVYTTDGRIHLYFPPFAFAEDAIVEIVESAELPGADPGAVLSAFQLAWDAPLRLAAVLDITVDRGLEPGNSPPMLYLREPGSPGWQALGGTLGAGGTRLSAPVDRTGTYVAATAGDLPAGEARLVSGLTLTPRVFSPRGGYAAEEIAVGFNLGRPSDVTVRIFSRTGRIVRELARSTPMLAGRNLVRWDGRDDQGRTAVSGLYFVTVEASGESESTTLAVVH